MQRITPHRPYPLFDTAATQRIERHAAAALPAHTLMQRAGLAVARLARALAPHARTIWIACGPGNNGGDGLEAAMHLHRQGLDVAVTWLGSVAHCPADARQSLLRAQQAGVTLVEHPPALGPQDLCIDALLGIGLRPGAVPERLLALLQQLHTSPATLLAVDVPTGLQADTGQYAAGFLPGAATVLQHAPSAARHTLSLLTLKPGLFTAAGRDAAGTVWLDDLLTAPPTHEAPCAWLTGPPHPLPRPHASHKGSYGDVAVVGGEGLHARGMGMVGAALLAARAALHSGAGRVLVCLLDNAQLPLDAQQPELMLRDFTALSLEQLTVVCGCGGGEAVHAVLAQVLARSARLVLDADGLNAIASSGALQQALHTRAQQGLCTILTPHPLEAARLLGTSATQVQAHRLAAAQQLAERFACVVVLKGSGTVVATPATTPWLNPTGNARLAAAGTGDVLAGMVAARWASGIHAPQAATEAVFAHGLAADQWPAKEALTAGVLAQGRHFF